MNSYLSRIWTLDDSGSVDLLVLPGVSAKLGDGSESTGRASFLPDMVGVPAAAAASDVCAFSSRLSERRRALCHSDGRYWTGFKIKVAFIVMTLFPLEYEHTWDQERQSRGFFNRGQAQFRLR